jgi:osmoprotectant transport system ATP-binding protein
MADEGARWAVVLDGAGGWIAVLDGDRFLGVLTPATLHSALRRSVGADIEGVDLRDVEVDTVARA